MNPALIMMDTMLVNITFQSALQTHGVMVWGATVFHWLSQLQWTVGNLNNDKYITEVLQPKVVPFLQGIHEAIFQ